MNKLPIEKNRELIIKYGTAFAWFSRVEQLLELLIIMEGKLYRINEKLINSFLNKKTLGNKIHIAKDILDSVLIKELNELNEKRISLVHGNFNYNPEIHNFDNYEISNSQKTFVLNNKNIDKIIKSTKRTSIKIEKELEIVGKKAKKEFKDEKEFISFLKGKNN